MKKVIVALGIFTGILIPSLSSSFFNPNQVVISDNHDLIVGIPGITKTEVETLLKSMEETEGVKKAKFCYNLECLIIIKDIKNLPSDANLLTRIQNAVPGKQTYIKEYTSIDEFEQQCNFIKR